jgi:hypothetical protein
VIVTTVLRRQVIPRGRKGGQWMPRRHVMRRSAMIHCPECGGVFDLGPEYSITVGGAVEPSVECAATPECAWSAHVVLRDWRDWARDACGAEEETDDA